MFRRRRESRREDNDEEPTDLAEDLDADGDDEPDGDQALDVADDRDLRANGPWDVDEVPIVSSRHDDHVTADDEDEYEDHDQSAEPTSAGEDEQSPAESGHEGPPRLDLGAIRVSPLEGMQVRIELDEATRQVRAVSVIDGDSALQLEAYAAPRSSGVWDDMRKELAADATRRGGTATEIAGPFGRELKISLPTRTKEGRTGAQVSRIVGVDGPRWMLRGSYFGRAADSAKGDRLGQVFRSVVVVRGVAPMAPGDPLPLTVPASAIPASIENQPGRAGPAAGGLGPLVRGPEITETR